MLTFIAYIFKIIISLVMGFLIGHDFKSNNEENDIVLHTSLLAFITTTFTSSFLNISNVDSTYLVGFLLFGMIYLINSFIQDFNKENKSKLIFASLIGIVTGFGYIFYSLLATIIFIYIYYNVNIFINLLSKSVSNDNEDIDINEHK